MKTHKRSGWFQGLLDAEKYHQKGIALNELPAFMLGLAKLSGHPYGYVEGVCDYINYTLPPPKEEEEVNENETTCGACARCGYVVGMRSA